MDTKETENKKQTNTSSHEKPMEKDTHSNGGQNEEKKSTAETSPLNENSNKEDQKPADETASEDENEKKLAELLAKNFEINDKYLRLYSDFDNFRKRTAKERIEIIRAAGSELVSLLLPVLDDFERAIKSNEKSEDPEAIREGVQLIFQKFKNILTLQGLKEMEIQNREFNSDLHEAITRVEAPDQKGKVIEVVEKGYYLNDKVIRHAKVIVGS